MENNEALGCGCDGQRDRQMDRWTEELTQQVEGHQLRRQEHAKAATPGCLESSEYQRRAPHTLRSPGSAGVQQDTTPLPGSASGCSRLPVGSTWSSRDGDAPQTHRDLSAAAGRHWQGSSKACKRIRKGPVGTRGTLGLEASKRGAHLLAPGAGPRVVPRLRARVAQPHAAQGQQGQQGQQGRRPAAGRAGLGRGRLPHLAPY